MSNRKTALFEALEKRLSLTQLFNKEKGFLEEYSMEFNYLLDVYSSSEININYDTADSVAVTGSKLNYTITNINLSDNTCQLLYDGEVHNAELEKYENFISVISCGEVFCILPLKEAYNER